MAEFIHLTWQSNLEPGLPRRDRQPCFYDAYLPDTISGRNIKLEGDVAADVADAERLLTKLDSEVEALANTEVLARLLLRAESVGSSRIEGLVVGARRLLHSQAAKESGLSLRDVTADEVIGSIDAMAWALETVPGSAPIEIEHIFEMHRRLLEHTNLAEHAGRIRDVQNWIGGSDYNPCGAEYVPPPPEYVHALLDDLCRFANEDGLPAVVQAALAHAQFETIHPFVDGNGRIGRALIHLILRRRDLVSRVLPPVSLILASWSKEYVGSLRATRYLGPPDSPDAHRGLNAWIGLFAAACQRAVRDAEEFEETVRAIEQGWRDRLGKLRKNSATDLLLQQLAGAPVLTVPTAATLIGRSRQATNLAFAQLVDTGVLTEVQLGGRSRAFEARDIIAIFTDLERRLASPTGDTRTSPPQRTVPDRT